jgi:hypothetical protein
MTKKMSDAFEVIDELQAFRAKGVCPGLENTVEGATERCSHRAFSAPV